MNITTPRLVKNFLLNCASLRLGSASERINLRTQKFLSANKCSPILFLQPQCSIFLLQRGIVFELLRQSSSIETCQPSDELSYPTNDPEGCADDRQSLRYLDVWSRWPLWRMKPSALNFAPGSPVINSKSVLKYLSIYISRIFTFGLCLSFKWPLSEGLAEDHLAICIVRFGTKLLVVPRSHADHCEDLLYNWNQKTLKNPRVPPTYLDALFLPDLPHPSRRSQRNFDSCWDVGRHQKCASPAWPVQLVLGMVHVRNRKTQTEAEDCETMFSMLV